jgi:uncharacterized protein YceH (UPF0502 family)
VLKLPRAPGAREARWTHLLCGPVDTSAMPVASDSESFVATGEMAALKAEQMALRAEVTTLRALVERLYDELGVGRDPS